MDTEPWDKKSGAPAEEEGWPGGTSPIPSNPWGDPKAQTLDQANRQPKDERPSKNGVGRPEHLQGLPANSLPHY